jgi:uncharacterized membrane protein
VAALGVVWWLGLERTGGKAALLVGVLFGLIGQTYQTGADTFELFATWAAAILPFVLVGRFAALWLVWLTLVNVAAVLYYTTFRGLFGVLFGPEQMVWVMFGVNTLALVAWEWAAFVGVEWLRERWATRLLATASGGTVSALDLMAVIDWPDTGVFAVPAWLAWLAAAYRY